MLAVPALSGFIAHQAGERSVSGTYARGPEDCHDGAVTQSDDSHDSPLRDLVAQAHGGRYVSYSSLREARAHEHGCVVLEGDDGGQIYAAIPAVNVRCSQSTLKRLLRDLDAIAWPSNDEDMARVVYEERRRGAAVAGGMGGGVVADDGWVHTEFASLGIDQEIREVLAGARSRLSESARAAQPRRRPRPPMP